MDTMTNDQVIAGLDVGSSRGTTVLGRRGQGGGRMTGLAVGSVFVGISGPLIKSFNSHAAISVKNEHEVTDADFSRVLEIARTVELPNDREILHVLTQEVTGDDRAGIKAPRGMTGIRLEARVHVVTNDVPGARNLARCVEKADLDVESFVLSPLASAEEVLTPPERAGGVGRMGVGGSAGGGWARNPPDPPTIPQRDHRAPRGRDLHPSSEGDPPVRLRGEPRGR